MGEVAAVVIGVAFLHIFFRAVESQWPASYFALTSGPDYAISRSLMRYLLFRLLPVFVAATFAAVTLARAGRMVLLPVAAMGVVHALVTSGRAMLGMLRAEQRRRRPLLAAMHPTVMLLVLGTAMLAGLMAPNFERYIPDLSAVTSDQWTGLIAGVVGAYAVRVSQRQHVDTEAVLRASRNSIPSALWEAVDSASAELGADPVLVRAVLLAENIQRPGWLRRLERSASRLLKRPATLGLLQIRGDATASEEELLRRAIEARFVGVPTTTAQGWTDYDGIRQFAISYNPDADYADLVVAAAVWLQQP